MITMKKENEAGSIPEQNGYVLVSMYMDKYGNSITDAELGAIVRHNLEKYRKKIRDNAEKWKKEGEVFKQTRQALNITQRELAESIGINPVTLSRYEKGRPVRSRMMLSQSGRTAMELIQLKRVRKLDTLKLPSITIELFDENMPKE